MQIQALMFLSPQTAFTPISLSPLKLRRSTGGGSFRQRISPIGDLRRIFSSAGEIGSSISRRRHGPISATPPWRSRCSCPRRARCTSPTWQDQSLPSDCRHLRLTIKQYELLVEQLTQTLKLDENKMPIQIPNTAYYYYDAFYEAHGVYHLFNTCNCWTGRTLRGAEVQAGIWTPFPQSVIKTVPLGPAD